MRILTLVLVLASVTLSAAIFGFFYAWVCSTMWGLDAADPRIAIEAMQAMNASVRNGVFAPAFFGTPIALLLAAGLLCAQRLRTSGALFALSAVTYFCFGLLLTMLVNVPMNETLAGITSPEDLDEARQIWEAYSPEWQFWNQFRTIASGAAFLLAVLGVLYMPPVSRSR